MFTVYSVVASSFLDNVDVVSILKTGLVGLVFLLSWMSYSLLRTALREDSDARDSVMSCIRYFISASIFSIAVAFILFLAELFAPGEYGDRGQRGFFAKNLDSFQDVMKYVVKVVENSDEDLVIMTDIAPYGCISATELYERYYEALYAYVGDDDKTSHVLWLSPEAENRYIGVLDKQRDSSILQRVQSCSVNMRELFSNETEADSPWLFYINAWSGKRDDGRSYSVISWVHKPTDEDAAESVQGIYTESEEVAKMIRRMYSSMASRDNSGDFERMSDVFKLTASLYPNE